MRLQPKPHRLTVVMLLTLGWTIPGGTANAENLWTAVARAAEREAADERRQAFAASQRLSVGAAGPNRAERNAVPEPKTKSQAIEAHLRRALAFLPADVEARRQLGELFSGSGRPRDAAREFESARQLVVGTAAEARLLFRVANERSRFGAYDEALDAYTRGLAADGEDPDAEALNNSAELLMAVGRIGEAIDRYREAIAIEERARDRRSHIQGIALGYFGLAVAFDRNNQPAAAREAMGRALGLDAGLSVLRMAERKDGDLFFVPPGDVFYYLGLAREKQGRTDDALAAFRNYLRDATGPYARQAQAHVARLGGNLDEQHFGAHPRASATPVTPLGPPGTESWRVVHEVTLAAEGPLVAPLIDAAWRLTPALLDPCLSDVERVDVARADQAPRTTREIKVFLTLNIDDGGRVTSAKVEPAAALPTSVAACMEDAVRTGLHVSRPSRRKSTRARVEVVLAPSAPSGV